MRVTVYQRNCCIGQVESFWVEIRSTPSRKQLINNKLHLFKNNHSVKPVSVRVPNKIIKISNEKLKMEHLIEMG